MRLHMFFRNSVCSSSLLYFGLGLAVWPPLFAERISAEVATPSEGGNAKQAAHYDWSADDMTTVHFIRGGSALTEAETLNIKAIYEKVSRVQPVERMLVVAWPDRDDVKKDKKALDAQITLTQKRAEAVKEALVNLSKKPVRSINMASDAGWIAKTFETRDAKVKDALKFPNARDEDSSEHKQAAAIADILLSRGGLGKAVVIMERSAKPGIQATGL